MILSLYVLCVMNSQILTATMMKDTREYRVSCLFVCVLKRSVVVRR